MALVLHLSHLSYSPAINGANSNRAIFHFHWHYRNLELLILLERKAAFRWFPSNTHFLPLPGPFWNAEHHSPSVSCFDWYAASSSHDEYSSYTVGIFKMYERGNADDPLTYDSVAKALTPLSSFSCCSLFFSSALALSFQSCQGIYPEPSPFGPSYLPYGWPRYPTPLGGNHGHQLLYE